MQCTGLAPIVQLICKSRRVPPPGFELRAGAATQYETKEINRRRIRCIFIVTQDLAYQVRVVSLVHVNQILDKEGNMSVK
jgi:hypothetical protein